MGWFRLTFILIHQHEWRLDEIENMYPFELDIYTTLLIDYIEMEKQAAEQANNNG